MATVKETAEATVPESAEATVPETPTVPETAEATMPETAADGRLVANIPQPSLLEELLVLEHTERLSSSASVVAAGCCSGEHQC